MSRNIEVKAYIPSVEALLPKATALAQQAPRVIAQDDTFFPCPHGRLKLRAFADGTGELIFYRRADESGPKESFYLLSPTHSPDSLREALSLAHGQAGRVRKQRILLNAGRTRIHLDRVEGLGDLLELEVVLYDDEPAEAGMHEAQALMASLGVSPAQWVDVAYVDLLARARVPGRFETRRAMSLAGLRRRHLFATMDAGILAQWREFNASGAVPGRCGAASYGVICGDDAEGVEYLTAVEVDGFDALPATLGRLRIEPQRYAVFVHHGHVSALRHRRDGALQWLAGTADWVSAQRPDVEVFGAGFDPVGGFGDMEIWISIVEPAAPT